MKKELWWKSLWKVEEKGRSREIKLKSVFLIESVKKKTKKKQNVEHSRRQKAIQSSFISSDFNSNFHINIWWDEKRWGEESAWKRRELRMIEILFKLVQIFIHSSLHSTSLQRTPASQPVFEEGLDYWISSYSIGSVGFFSSFSFVEI